MKRVVSLLLCIIILASSTDIALAKENEEDTYTTISAEFSDNIGVLENLKIMVKNNHVYANAEELGVRLGYEIKISEDYIVIHNQSANNVIPDNLTVFYYGSTQVVHNLFNKMIKNYEAPFETIKNENGIWIPLEYSLLLLNSSMLVVDNVILIDMPSKNIIDIFMDIAKNQEKYDFDWQQDVGISEKNEEKMGKASFIVTMFNGVLDMEGESWAQFLQSVSLDSSSYAYDAKYGEKLAMLFCTYSSKELKEETSKLKKVMSHFNGQGAIGKTISALDEYGEEKIGELLKKSEKLKSKIDISNSKSIISYNKAYQALENVCDKVDFFSDATDLYMQVGQEIQRTTSFLDKFYKIAEVIGFATEFKNQDEYAVKVLTEFVSNSNCQSVMSEVMKNEIKNYLNILRKDMASYSLFRYLKEHYDDLIFDATDLVSALSLDSRLLLIAWDVASGIIPFFEEGLRTTNNFMLSIYANIFKAEGFILYQTVRNSVFSDIKNINSENLYKVSKYCYTYLKSCYITRNAALGTLREDVKKEIPNVVEYQNEINKEIATYLVQLKSADLINEKGCYGFLIEDNRKYLENYNETSILKIVEVNLESEIIKNKSEKEIIIEKIEAETDLYCKWIIQADFNKDGNQEAFVFVCNSDTDYSNGEIWYCSTTNKKLLFWLNAWEGELFYKLVTFIPEELIIRIIEIPDNIDEFISYISQYFF